MRVRASQRLSGEAVGGHTHQADLRVTEEEPEELGSHVAARSGDRYARHVGPSRHYRFEYWNFCRAPGWPYFFRSRMRGSRVSRRSEERRVGKEGKSRWV